MKPVLVLFGWLFFIADVFFEKASDIAEALHEQRAARKAELRRRWLMSLDPDALRKEGDLGSVILAKQAELARSRLVRVASTAARAGSSPVLRHPHR